MKKFFDAIFTLLFLLLLVGLGYWAWQNGYIGIDGGKVWFNPNPAPSTAATPYAPTPQVTLPSPEEFPHDVGGTSVFYPFEEATPLPPICSAFECDVALANEFWAQLPGAQGYAVGGNIIASGVDIVHSAEVEQSVSQWDWYADTHKRVVATIRLFARAAVDPARIKVVLSEKGDGVVVTVIPPELCLDSAGVALVDPSEGRPVEMRIEVAQNYATVYDTCAVGNWLACIPPIYGNAEYNTLRMGQNALQKAATEAMNIIAASDGLRQSYADSVTGAVSPTVQSEGEILSLNQDQWGQPIATSAHDILVLIGKAVACDVLTSTGRICDPSLMEVVVQAPPQPAQLIYCNGREFTGTTIDLSKVEQWLPEFLPTPQP